MTAEFAAAFMCRVPNTWDWPSGQCNDRVKSALSLHCSSTNQNLACLLELPRGHKYTYRYRACCLAVDHDLEDTNFNGQKGIYLLILCPAYRVSHHVQAGDFMLIGRQSHCSLCVQACLLEPNPRTYRSHPRYLANHHLHPDNSVLNISSACFLYLKPFLDSVESGFIRSDDVRRRGSDYKSGGGSTKRNIFLGDSVDWTKPDGTRMKSLGKPHYAADIEGVHASNRGDSGSQHSRIQIIKETRTFAVGSFPDVHDTSPYRSKDAY